jgi:protease IV
MKNKKPLFIILGIIGGFWIISIILAAIFGVIYSFGDNSFDFSSKSGNVAVIPMHGAIYVNEPGSLSMDGVTSDQIIDQLDKASNDPGVKAIILDINSPGGSGVAADEISQKIKTIDIPVISVIRDSGASAAYWIATSTDRIFANRMSLTGSIGVIGSYLDFSDFITEYNVSYQRYVSGDLKDMGSAFKKPSTKEQEVFQKIISKMNDFFIKEVAQNRNMSVNDVRKLATGEVYLGIDAKENGLIDELGTRNDAIKYLENELNITISPVVFKERKTLSSLFELNSKKIGNFINSGPSFEFK